MKPKKLGWASFHERRDKVGGKGTSEDAHSRIRRTWNLVPDADKPIWREWIARHKGGSSRPLEIDAGAISGPVARLIFQEAKESGFTIKMVPNTKKFILTPPGG